MLSTSRVKSYNSKIKRLIFNSNTTLLELADKLSLCILEEDKKTEYALFRASIPKAVLVAIADTILANVYNMLRKYLTVEMLKIQEDQIKQALYYHAVIINLDDPTLFGENPKFTDITAKSMFSLVDNNRIVEIEVSCNSAQEPFLVAQNFEMEELVTMGWSSLVPYLNTLVLSQDVHNINYKMLNEQDCQGLSSSDSNVTSDRKLDPRELMNPQKRKAKGRPKGTNRIRRANEPSKKTKRQLRCKICGGASHNRATCSQRKE
ncbi:11217_t:CDS:2 [Gigaspora rosea]|nr:11217_t:CDS:2 [Gigaspora rosea]